MSSDSDIGNQVEAELEAHPRKSRTAPNRLTNSQKFELLEKYKRGKLDKYYNVLPDKKRKGEFKFVKRRVPLDLPPNYDNDVGNERYPVEQKPVEPVKTITTSDILKDDKQTKLHNEFFQFQASINNSLQKTLDDLQEKYTTLSNKFDEDRKAKPKRTVKKSTPKPKSKLKPERKPKKQSEEEEYEVVYEYVDDPKQLTEAFANEPKIEAPQTVQPQVEIPQAYLPYIRRRQIDIRDF